MNIICDAEIMFLNKKGTYEAIKKVCQRAEIMGTELIGDTEPVQTINQQSIRVLPYEWRQELKALTNHYRFIAWWSNIPVYERKYLPEFFKILGSNYLGKLNFYSFDHVIYYLFLVYRGYWKFCPIEKYGHSVVLECSPYLNVFKDVSKHFPLLWVNYQTYVQDLMYFQENPDVFMVFHLDRHWALE